MFDSNVFSRQNDTSELRLAIEKGLKQKTRQNVVVLDWGSRSNAALKILV